MQMAQELGVGHLVTADELGAMSAGMSAQWETIVGDDHGGLVDHKLVVLVAVKLVLVFLLGVAVGAALAS